MFLQFGNKIINAHYIKTIESELDEFDDCTKYTIQVIYIDEMVDVEDTGGREETLARLNEICGFLNVKE